jgi:hypothetical protein
MLIVDVLKHYQRGLRTAVPDAKRHNMDLGQMPVAFVALNIADAYLTHLVLSVGGIELNPLAEPFGSNILMRAVLASVAAAALLVAGKRGWLHSLSVLVLWVVMWNLWQYAMSQVTLVF